MGGLLAIDGGRSTCRVAVIGPEGRSAIGAGPGLPTLTGPDAFARVVQTIGEAVSPWRPNLATIDVVAAGLAGFLGSLAHAGVLAGQLARSLGIERVVLTSDVVTAYAGALGVRPGVVVTAGTGAVALAVATGDTPGPPGGTGDTPGPPGGSGDPPGSVARADGWGHLLGDAGSGFWIGRRGLEQALRAYDGRGGSVLLADLVEAHAGSLDQLAARIQASPDPVATVAAFSRQVAEAAGQGDRVARSIWDEAAAELAASAAGCARRVFPPGTPVPVSWSGGLFAAAGSAGGGLLLEPFLDRLFELLPGCVPTPPEGDALAGAALLAGPHGPGLLGRFVHDSAHVLV